MQYLLIQFGTTVSIFVEAPVILPNYFSTISKKGKQHSIVRVVLTLLTPVMGSWGCQGTEDRTLRSTEVDNHLESMIRRK